MMKSFLHLFVGALLLLNGMIYSVIQGSYELNKASIIANFCVNKSQPELNCDGKCYLAQQLKAEKEKQEQNSSHFFSFDFGQYICITNLMVFTSSEIELQCTYPLPSSDKLPLSFFASVDIPPRL
jgi:hypothetical protein